MKTPALAIGACALLLSACGATSSKSIETQKQTALWHVCIVENAKAGLPQWSHNLATSLKKHNISSTIIRNPQTPELQSESCRFTLRYNVITPNGLPNTLRRASIRMVENTDQGRATVGALNFKLRGQHRQYIQNPNLQAQTDALVDELLASRSSQKENRP